VRAPRAKLSCGCPTTALTDDALVEFAKIHVTNDVRWFIRDRLGSVAGFKHVAEPMPMRNSTKAVVYYLMFASQKAVAEEIVRDIFAKYGQRGA
jgi:hypothetical protein